MAVRAKFVVCTITRGRGSVRNPETGEYEQGEVRTVCLQPVSGGSEENRKFWAASPNGRIELGCANLAAAEQFELGQELYVDFTPATPAEGS